MKRKIQGFLIARPVFALAAMFVALIILAAGVIFWFERGNTNLSFIDALFTAASAATVTGLTVKGTYLLSFASKVAVLVTIQLGALMVMNGALFILSLARNKPHEGNAAAASLFFTKRIEDFRFVLVFVLVIETAAAMLLFVHFREDMGAANGLWFAWFHAVSAFCNAGFSLFPNDFYSFRSDPYVLSVAMGEIILGGLGFVVIVAMKIRLFAFLKGKKVYSWPLQAKVILGGSIALFVAGFAVFFALEATNVLRGMSVEEQALISAFQSVSARTAGFSTIDMGSVTLATQFFFMLLMLIGGGSASMAGGIKVTTFVVLFLKAWQRRRDIKVGGRVIPHNTVSRANNVFLLSLMTVFCCMFFLLIFESIALRDILFETVSAFGTVGLSTGITPSLSVAGKILLSFLMLIGKIGPATLTYIWGKEIIEHRSLLQEKEVEVG